MALRAVLVDRGRRVWKEAGAQRVEGRTPMVEMRGDWFACRLFLDHANEQLDPQESRFSAVPQPQLMYATLDAAGDPIVLSMDDQVEVSSVELGTALWKVNGEAQPLRKKRRVLGWLATLERVIEPTQKRRVVDP